MSAFTAGSPGLLLMWWNAPAVVIGRHQNPWVECSLSAASKLGVAVARRNSGGGTVYHDAGNLNCCFMGHKRDYRRKANLQFIADTLKAVWGVQCMINARDDVLVQNAFKVTRFDPYQPDDLSSSYATVAFMVQDVCGGSSESPWKITAHDENIADISAI
ncbi:hypothetical protein HPB51_007183 [Rhipicephalus microplus]|uniref:BPL/LPL catalytic domain-containing protein n=1 Tax=Rhipicephalus microplus TaxID=6941 RepID=A0A9J6E0L2_RHIMP|nr:hypothetical protein HPB51_007183 [Rhipicephalus microplus]